MTEARPVVSKVLVLDDARSGFEGLRVFCEECGLVGIRPLHGDAEAVMAVLDSNVDLGAIMLYENYGGDAAHGMALAREIHAARPELPIFLRRDATASLAGLHEREAGMFRCAYTLADLQHLRATVDASLFSRVYPNALVRGIAEMTRGALASLFPRCEVDVDTPYLVKDRIIYGEVFTLIAIESPWCRGYMMLQAAEDAALDLVRRDTAAVGGDAVGFRELNNVLGEATNLVWGAFKNRYAGSAAPVAPPLLTQVPIIINHQRRYISFGSDDPQLCLRYTLRERGRADAAPVPVFQRFIFNLSWQPDAFEETPSVEALVEAGELELF